MTNRYGDKFAVDARGRSAVSEQPEEHLAEMHARNPKPARKTMCIECEELQRQIKRYRVFEKGGFDVFTVERIKELIEDLERRKDSLHKGSLHKGFRVRLMN
jgi:hypothetical protein